MPLLTYLLSRVDNSCRHNASNKWNNSSLVFLSIAADN